MSLVLQKHIFYRSWNTDIYIYIYIIIIRVHVGCYAHAPGIVFLVLVALETGLNIECFSRLPWEFRMGSIVAPKRSWKCCILLHVWDIRIENFEIGRSQIEIALFCFMGH